MLCCIWAQLTYSLVMLQIGGCKACQFLRLDATGVAVGGGQQWHGAKSAAVSGVAE